MSKILPGTLVRPIHLLGREVPEAQRHREWQLPARGRSEVPAGLVRVFAETIRRSQPLGMTDQCKIAKTYQNIPSCHRPGFAYFCP